MTVVLCAFLLASGGLCERGGHALPASDPSRGGPAGVVFHVRELERFSRWVCIHNGEGAWNDTGDPYWGGLQMDRGFMRTYGADAIARHHGGLADTWTPAEQIVVAERAYRSGRGFSPWPTTAPNCGYSVGRVPREPWLPLPEPVTTSRSA